MTKLVVPYRNIAIDKAIITQLSNDGTENTPLTVSSFNFKVFMDTSHNNVKSDELWYEKDIIFKPQMKLGKYGITTCFYKNTVTQEALLVRFSWSNDKSIKNKGLENRYKYVLKNGLNNFTYKEVKTDATQSLFGKVVLKNREHNYHLKKRYDNYLEMGVDITTKNDNTQKQQKLLELLLNKATIQ